MKKALSAVYIIVAATSWIGVASSSLASSPSFDCSKATTDIEKLICSNDQLSEADAQLSDTYKKALANASNKDAVKQAEQYWIKQERNACHDVDCLLKAYHDRIAVFTPLPASPVVNNSAEIPTGAFHLIVGGNTGLLRITKHPSSSMYEIQYTSIHPNDPMSRCFMRWDDIKPEYFYKLTRLDSCDDPGEGHKCEHDPQAVDGGNAAAFTLNTKYDGISLAADDEAAICIRDGKILNGTYTKIDDAEYQSQIAIIAAEVGIEQKQADSHAIAANKLLPCNSEVLHAKVKQGLGILALSRIGEDINSEFDMHGAVLKAKLVTASLKEDRSGADYKICSSLIHFSYGKPLIVTQHLKPNGSLESNIVYATGNNGIGNLSIDDIPTDH